MFGDEFLAQGLHLHKHTLTESIFLFYLVLYTEVLSKLLL